MVFRRRGWRIQREDQSAATPKDPVAPKPSVDDAADALRIGAPAATDRTALPVDETSVAELREGLSDAGDNLDEVGAVLDDAAADGPDDLTGSSGRLGSANALGDTPDFDTRLSGPDAPTTGDDLAPTVGFDDPVVGDDAAEVTNSTVGGTSDPTGFGMGDTGSSTPSDLRQTDQSTMTLVGGGHDDGDVHGDFPSDRSQDWIAEGVVANDANAQAEGSDEPIHRITAGLAEQDAYERDAAGHEAVTQFVEQESQEWADVIHDAARGYVSAPENPDRESEAEPPKKPKPEEKPEPEPDENIGPVPETEPEGPDRGPQVPDPPTTPTDGPETVVRLDPDADPVAPLQGREPAMGDVINLDPEVEIDSPDSLKHGFVDEDELIRPTNYDEPISEVSEFGRVDPSTQIMEDGGDMGDMGDMEGP